MDQLTVTIAPEESRAYYEPALGLYATAIVNEQRCPDVLDIDVFFEALSGSGLLRLFTCTCGFFGCGGSYVEVICEESAWIWRNRYQPEDEPHLEHMLEDREVRFVWSQVRVVASDLLAALHRVQRDRPEARLMVAFTGSDLRDRLEQYEQQIRAIPHALP